jgi:hypothetical protein
MRVTNFDAIPDQMAQLKAIGAQKGLSMASYLRMLISEELRRVAREVAKDRKRAAEAPALFEQ